MIQAPTADQFDLHGFGQLQSSTASNSRYLGDGCTLILEPTFDTSLLSVAFVSRVCSSYDENLTHFRAVQWRHLGKQDFTGQYGSRRLHPSNFFVVGAIELISTAQGRPAAPSGSRPQNLGCVRQRVLDWPINA